MQGDADIISLLNECLSHEFAAINQYFIHSKMCKDWGYTKIADKKYAESIEEMRHADRIIDRILFLEGIPNMQRINPVRVGEEPIEQHRLDLALELEARERLQRGISLCFERGDHTTRELLQNILNDEEEGVDWLETQLSLAEKLGAERYLAEML